MTVGLLHPGEMGAAIGAARGRGETVLWASAGRSAATAARAEAAGLQDAGTVKELASRSDVSSPSARPMLPRGRTLLAGFDGVYVDANAVSPATARRSPGVSPVSSTAGSSGRRRARPGTTRLYLSGAEAPVAAALFGGTIVDARVVSPEPGAASAVKMAYAAWTKGTAALLLAIRALARAEGVDEALLDEWRLSLPELPERSTAAARSALGKGWRWVGEMEEIADTFAAAGLPDGFHRAAAEIYRRSPRDDPAAADALEHVLSALRKNA